MCLMDAPKQPATPEPPAAAVAPLQPIEPRLTVKQGQARRQISKGKQRYRNDTTVATSKGTGLNIPT